jgi:hypothetical protein
MLAGGRRRTCEKRNAASDGNAKQYAEGTLARYARTQALACPSARETEPSETKYTTADLTPNGFEVLTKLTRTMERSKPDPPLSAGSRECFDWIASKPLRCLRLAREEPVAPDLPVGPTAVPVVERLWLESAPHEASAKERAEIRTTEQNRTPAMVVGRRPIQSGRRPSCQSTLAAPI